MSTTKYEDALKIGIYHHAEKHTSSSKDSNSQRPRGKRSDCGGSDGCRCEEGDEFHVRLSEEINEHDFA